MEQCISEAVIWERLKNKNTNKWNLFEREGGDGREGEKQGEGRKRESRGADEEEKRVIRSVHTERLGR